MRPPIVGVDHRIGPSPLPFEERRALRRHAPEALRFDLPPPGPLSVPVAVPPPADPARAPVALRVRLGLALISWGRRLAGPAMGP
ncbi:hypothetical protein [Rubellimicrobium aerolatum]|uniref:Uncharacterized protein n=1 Tax=Rubellimicrobium aerolatum TaxID=490979 RepID=A0ABW0SDB7_9RHOB|nr:hypothetical protein [Rubellimicrobium aerolatum]MBP1805715.1 hypothetical protein [Rubellimicrobium aerolatum]